MNNDTQWALVGASTSGRSARSGKAAGRRGSASQLNILDVLLTLPLLSTSRAASSVLYAVVVVELDVLTGADTVYLIAARDLFNSGKAWTNGAFIDTHRREARLVQSFVFLLYKSCLATLHHSTCAKEAALRSTT